MSFERVIAEGIDARATRAFARASGRPVGERPVIVKAISGIKRKSGAAALVRYVGRLGAGQTDPIDGGAIGDPLVRLYDESGDEVPREEAMATFEAWHLLTDRANGIRGNPARPRNVQVRHFVLSAPVTGRGEREALRQAAAATIQETFGEAGHRCLWAMHEEHGGFPHVHVVIDARNRITGRRMRLDRRGELLDGMRAVLARHVGMLTEVARDPSRRADREELIERVRQLGDERRRAAEVDEGAGADDRRRGDRRPWQTPLAEAAPEWWRDRGAAGLRRQGERLRRKRAAIEAARAARRDDGSRTSGKPRLEIDRPPSPRPPPSPARTGLGGLFDRLVGSRREDAGPRAGDDPAARIERRLDELGVFRVDGADRTAEAVRSFLALRDEAEGTRRGLAEWTLRKRPWLFADVSAAWRRIEGDEALRQAIRSLPPPAGSRARPGVIGGDAVEGGSAEELLRWARVERERAILVRSLATLAGGLERLAPMDSRRLREAAELRDRAYDFATAAKEVLGAVLAPRIVDLRPEAGAGARPSAALRPGPTKPGPAPPRRPGRTRGREDRER